MTYDRRKSDSPIQPRNPANKGGRTAAPPAEREEERGLAKGNAREQPRSRAQTRIGLQQALERVRQAAVRDRALPFTTLWHHVYGVDRLREAYLGLKRQAAPGVDHMTWSEYGQGLEDRLQDLSARLKRGAYRAKPVKRTYIPKADGGRRPLGVAALEDKLVQKATVEVLNTVYEVDFLGFSHGFRPGRSPHHALDALAVGIQRRKVNWVLDADIRGFFDTIDHEWLMRFVEHGVRDRRVGRHLRKWLNAGVLEEGRRIDVEAGMPQGAVYHPCWRTSTCTTSSTCGRSDGESDKRRVRSLSCATRTTSWPAFNTEPTPRHSVPTWPSGWRRFPCSCTRTRRD